MYENLRASVDQMTTAIDDFVAAGRAERMAHPAPAAPLVHPADYPFQTPVDGTDGQRLAAEWAYHKAVSQTVAQTPQQQTMLQASSASLKKADSAFVARDRPTAEFAVAFGRQILDAVLDGGISNWARNTYIAMTGIDPGTGAAAKPLLQGAALVLTVDAVELGVAAAGEIIVPVAAGIAIVGGVCLIAQEVISIAKSMANDSDLVPGDVKVSPADPPPIPVPTFDWKNPARPPIGADGKEWEWRGHVEPGTKGNWVEPNGGPGRLNPDLAHPPSELPHWDYELRGSEKNGKWKIYGDGTIVRVK